MARKIYPLITEYITENRPIDNNFIVNYIKLYETNYSNWINELDHIMTYRYVITEDEKDFNIIDQLFPNRSSAEYETEISENSITKMQKTPLTKVIIVSKNNSEKLKLLKRKFKELNNWKFNADIEFNYKILLDDKSQLIIINQKKSTIETLFKIK